MSAMLLPNGEQQFTDQAGLPLQLGTVGFYIPGTLTKKNTWQDPDENILNANPVVLDTAGRAIIYGSGTYRQIVKDVLGNLIWDQLTEGIDPDAGITQEPTGFFFSGNGARIDRLNDRVFVGGATENDGAFPNVVPDWLATYQSYFYAAGGVPPTVTTMMNVLGSATGALGGEPLLGGGHTANGTSTGANAIGIQGYGIANNTNFGGDFSWGFYGEGHRAHEGTGNCYGAEICVVNRASTRINTPYFSETGSTICLQLDSGCGFDNTIMPDIASASTALQIVDNTNGHAPFLNGICFGNGSVKDGGGGRHPAMVMPQGYEFDWFISLNTPTSYIQGNVATANKSTGIIMNDVGFIIGGESLQSLMVVPNIVNAANNVAIDANIAGGDVGVRASGADTNINLHLLPKGTGTLLLAGPTSSSSTGGGATALPAAPVEYATILYNGNLRKISLYQA